MTKVKSPFSTRATKKAKKAETPEALGKKLLDEVGSRQPVIETSMYTGGADRLPVVQKLFEKGAEPDEASHQQRTALMWAAYNGHTRIAEEIARKGGEFSLQSEYGPPYNAIEWANENDKTETADALKKLRPELELEPEQKKRAEEKALEKNIRTHTKISAPKRASFRKKAETAAP